jgi:hypothetical protein
VGGARGWDGGHLDGGDIDVDNGYLLGYGWFDDDGIRWCDRRRLGYRGRAFGFDGGHHDDGFVRRHECR